MEKTLLFGSIVTLATMSSLAVAPIAEATPAPTPGTVGGTCPVEGRSGQSLKIIGLKFEVEGTATVTNYGSIDLPLTQTLKESGAKSWDVGDSADFDPLKLFHVILSVGYQSTQTWEVSQTPGPYPVKPGYTGVLGHGFLNQSFEGTHLTCKDGKRVDASHPHWGTTPKERHIRVSTHTSEADRSMDGAAP